ncbi:hypothetical protein DENSPDRAFT_880659 [Dentipellis sp. KUC8613]|nr:hypothetical protein DENSPDRAFT_880659 [Dentipellis sp. KUC8613]
MQAPNPNNSQGNTTGLPPAPWDAICDPSLAQHINNIPAGSLFTPHARIAETARIVTTWSSDHSRTPFASNGFHPAFIRNAAQRKETRERLVQLMRDILTALERSCGAAGTIIVIHGEMSPGTAQQPAASLNLEKNIRIYASDIFTRPTVFFPSLDDFHKICIQELGPAFIRDFRRRALAAHYLGPNLIEAPTPTLSLVQPRGGASSQGTPSSTPANATPASPTLPPSPSTTTPPTSPPAIPARHLQYANRIPPLNLQASPAALQRL